MDNIKTASDNTIDAEANTKRKHELREALRAISSTIGKCEKAQLKLTEGTPQHTLTKRRLEAFYIAISLIEKELREENDGNEAK